MSEDFPREDEDYTTVWEFKDPPYPMGFWEWAALVFLLVIIVTCVYDVWRGITSLFG